MEEAQEPQGLFNRLVHFFVVNQDPRTKNWFLSHNMVPLATILATYLYFCLYAGPKWMKNRKPFELKRTMVVYNAVQVVMSMYMTHEGLVAGWLRHYNYKCQPVDYSNDPLALRMASVVWVYYMCKLIELLDTVFFVLRKKQNQISFLHVYHHTMMPFAGFIGTKYLAGGHTTLLGVINSFIHVVMYIYYMISAVPSLRKYLWWKKYLTVMQIVQFGVVFIHTLQVQFYPDCKYPKGIAALLSTNAALFFYMFSSFYYHAYVKPRKSHTNGACSNGLQNGKLANGHANGKTSNGHANGTGNGKLLNGHVAEKED